MKASIATELKNTPEAKDVESILQKCVHCGLCNATCPTYRVTADELDGPRGRIYQIKTLFETNQAYAETQLHLDRCLDCRKCEITCPSSVEYGRLLDIARHWIEPKVPRTFAQRIIRKIMVHTLPYSKRTQIPIKIAQLFYRFFPEKLRQHIPKKEYSLPDLKLANNPSANTTFLIPQGCVQSVSKANTVKATEQLLQKLGFNVKKLPAKCCGALAYHLIETEISNQQITQNINEWYAELQNGGDYIIMTASGCGAMVKDYQTVQGLSPEIKQKAKAVVEATKDLSEILSIKQIQQVVQKANKQLSVLRTVFHPPCTLTNAQKLSGKVEALLIASGIKLLPFPESDQCCGSAGSYSILQPKFAQQIKQKKIRNIQSVNPDIILTANIGCQLYIESDVNIPVRHWIEIVNERI